VASVHAVGHPLTSDHVHRVDHVAACTSLERGDTITTEAIASLLTHPEGGLKNVPRDATVIPLVNKADTSEDEQHASEIIETTLDRAAGIEAGIVAELRENRIIRIG
jgi:probable selenium-dependent hydroxylase accessory protein YqeC